MQKGLVLRDDVDFEYAIQLKTHIEVWQHGERIDHGGIIKSHDRNTVSINDGRYLKAVSEFRVR